MNALLFEEIQLIGSKKVVKRTEAKLFPERNFVRDLLIDYKMMADEITESEYLEISGSQSV